MVAPMGPDERVFREHIARGPFLSGVDRGRWRLAAIDWPCATIAVAAAPRPGGPAEYALRFDLGDYPQSPPTARLWDVGRDEPLAPAEWPGGRGRVPLAFNPAWRGGDCLYLPCDRLSIVGHDPWLVQHPTLVWSPSGDISQYLRLVHDLLNTDDYTGSGRA